MTGRGVGASDASANFPLSMARSEALMILLATRASLIFMMGFIRQLRTCGAPHRHGVFLGRSETRSLNI